MSSFVKMGVCRKEITVLIFLVLIMMNVGTLQAWRPLERELLLQREAVLARVPVPPSGNSHCTYIPGQGDGDCHNRRRKT
ncbi:hypothetical protein AAC387_Pa08g0936 [Persea americana]